MERYARNFVGVSVGSFIAGTLLGVLMIFFPGLTPYTPIHVHFLLLGFMSMMIFGVGYHIIPRFQGHALIPYGWATLHFHLATWGLLAMVIGWYFDVSQGPDSALRILLPIGACAQFAGFIIFAVIIYRGLVPVKR